jgi:hypothetical protein
MILSVDDEIVRDAYHRNKPHDTTFTLSDAQLIARLRRRGMQRYPAN